MNNTQKKLALVSIEAMQGRLAAMAVKFPDIPEIPDAANLLGEAIKKVDAIDPLKAPKPSNQFIPPLDRVQQFLSDALVPSATGSVTINAAYGAFWRWTTLNGQRVCRRSAFNLLFKDLMQQRQIQIREQYGQEVYLGIALAQEYQPKQPSGQLTLTVRPAASSIHHAP